MSCRKLLIIWHVPIITSFPELTTYLLTSMIIIKLYVLQVKVLGAVTLPRIFTKVSFIVSQKTYQLNLYHFLHYHRRDIFL